METHKHNLLKTIATGLIIIVAGVLWLLKNMGILSPELSNILLSWPMLLVAIGFVGILGKGKIFHFVVFLVGAFYLYARIYQVPAEFHTIFWPSLLIFIGISIIAKILTRKKNVGPQHEWFEHHHDVDNDFLNETNVFGGGDINVVSQNFKGGKLKNVFGGSRINLMNAQLAPGKVEIDVTCIFGGFQLIVPADWIVKSEVTSIFGGISDKRQVNHSFQDQSEPKILILKGTAIFGGGDIKNVLIR